MLAALSPSAPGARPALLLVAAMLLFPALLLAALTVGTRSGRGRAGP